MLPQFSRDISEKSENRIDLRNGIDMRLRSKAMRILLLLLTALFVLNSNALCATYSMNINLTGGEVVTIPVEDIQRIDFGDCGGVEDPQDPQDIVRLFELMQNRPNPFNPSTTIEYQLPRAADVKISVFDVGGPFRART